jgi:hypothetical protein
MSGLFSPPSTPNANQVVAAAGLQIQTSAYGLPVPILFGQNQTSPNLLQLVGFKAIQVVAPPQGGASFGNNAPPAVSYTYTVTPILGICEGTITSFDTIRKDKENPINLAVSPGYWQLSFKGDQVAPWTYMTASFASQARTYPKIAYMSHLNYNLGSNTGLPNFSIVVTGLDPYNVGADYYDAHPVTIIKQLL